VYGVKAGPAATGEARRRAAVGALLVVLLAVVAARATLDRPGAGPAAPSPSVAAAGGLVWSDEFTGAVNTAPDGTRWTRNTGGGGWGNGELEYYTGSLANAALDGAGHLAITARRENPGGYACHYGPCAYTSARLLTAGRFSRTFGRFEAGLKLPRGRGLWPAFWMLGDDAASARGGEIDVMENVGSEPGTVHGSLHGPGYSADHGLTTPFTLPGGRAVADDFHVFAVDWTPDAITWFVDGVPYTRKTRADVGGHEWVFDHPFFLIINLAVGGTWPGAPPAGTVFPQSMLVDYVRVYANNS
jgi:beta-glucanase (GH16 family)